jgi:predicted nucleic acid-binding protein
MLVPPAELVLDTPFVVDALLRSQPRHEVCRAYLTAIAGAHSTVIFNRLLEPELWEAAYRIAIRERYPGRRASDVRHDGRTRQRAKTLQRRLEAAWNELLTALDWLAIEVGEVREWVPQLMARGLASYDAVHAATALYTDVRPFVTLDYHFSFISEHQLELYVPASRVRACRERRATHH